MSYKAYLLAGAILLISLFYILIEHPPMLHQSIAGYMQQHTIGPINIDSKFVFCGIVMPLPLFGLYMLFKKEK